ncbi:MULTISPECIES: threonine synthase [Streptosporangium]|uniref:Threonine synthase n=1 Tax=Streptosporangium brasiliense TaxID=47480 RepID=A0ABT9R366_9ACTN|nr:pyridoxal-phosphate dependent enzyme [Streptosporangium brasiliense]MDP9863317.1 threonine synthase [Streptosporangium brasiliense]
MHGDSLAVAQRSLGDPSIAYPLWPPMTRGCPATSTPEIAYPVEVDYAYDKVQAGLFDREIGPDLARWAPLLPPLHAPTLGEGGTPLVEIEGVFVKDESRNPTWSHKDRLNRCTVSGALGAGAPGIVAASSGNHGASAAAYAARAGLPCVILASADSPPAIGDFIRSYGAVVLPVPAAERRPLMRRIVDELGFHPVSNLSVTHTGHGFGPEGYKTIAYELHRQVGVPAAVFVPTGYGELIYGVWKGFTELRRLGITSATPRMFSCEPAAGGPLARALATGLPAVSVEVRESLAYAIDCPVNGYRGVVAVRDSGGGAVLSTDEEMAAAQRDLARRGLWHELSSAAALAGYRKLGERFDGPVVCVSTSSGFKDLGVGSTPTVPLDPSWPVVREVLRARGI